MPVHPRARGERIKFTDGRLMPSGSSPRSRGTAPCELHDLHRGRFIPALAGNGCSRLVARTQATVHPRARGERHIGAKVRQVFVGSSPRSRGTVNIQPILIRAERFIPALAGNGGEDAGLRRVLAVHPRTRGERSNGVGFPAMWCGSSPRSRGTAANHRRSACKHRFIPALAGNGEARKL